MAIRTQESISGFIASDPQLKVADNGKARFYARFGQRHYRATGPGEFEELEATFHDLVIHGKTAERAYERFAKGDRFVAEGYIDRDEYTRDGQTVTGEKFVAKKIGTTLLAPPTPSNAPAASRRRLPRSSSRRPGQRPRVAMRSPGEPGARS
ncbi:single-stranded DNA-binding protein [Microbacterium lacticum]